MKTKNLDESFRKAVEKINQYKDPLPADFLLRLYAYYKIANEDYSSPKSKNPLISAFKTNALFQVRDISQEEAKVHYVTLTDNYFANGSLKI